MNGQMEKGLEQATGEEALGTKPRSHQQAVPPPSSVGQEPGSSHRDYPRHSPPSQAHQPRLSPLLPVLSRSQPSHKAWVCQMHPARHGPTSPIPSMQITLLVFFTGSKHTGMVAGGLKLAILLQLQQNQLLCHNLLERFLKMLRTHPAQSFLLCPHRHLPSPSLYLSKASGIIIPVKNTCTRRFNTSRLKKNLIKFLGRK